MIELTTTQDDKHWVAARFVVNIKPKPSYPAHSIVRLTTGEEIEIYSRDVDSVIAQLSAAEI